MRFLSYVSILILACCGAMRPARALNGTINLTSCACQTTAEFAAAARQQAHLFDQYGGGSPDGNYIIASSSGAMSAAVSVTGHYVIKNHDVGPVWVTDAVTPIDSNGNSLAGQSEASLESFYGAFDATIMSASRSSPTIIQEPTDYTGSFINSLEEEVVPGIGKALILLGIDPSFFEVGSVITVKFDDGTTAQYKKVSNTSSYQWSWNGVAHNKAGKRINRDGTVIPSTASAGGGSFDVRGFGTGTGGGINWDWAGDGLRGVVTITPADDSGSAGGGSGSSGGSYLSYY